MFMFSRKLVFLIIVMMLVFGGCSVKGLQCWECSGKDNVCDADHNGGTCDGETCLLQQVRDKQDYRKFCRGDVSDFIGCRQEGHSSRPVDHIRSATAIRTYATRIKTSGVGVLVVQKWFSIYYFYSLLVGDDIDLSELNIAHFNPDCPNVFSAVFIH
ncbi:unnamed protein product [Orchesella dallaii]|uniref:Uncharacterized protein n=1 Tax=Orchesella dallaii TaxID=48710 RepID=A0ABP1PSZ0_9HEXA